jgi:hypothetical protein
VPEQLAGLSVDEMGLGGSWATDDLIGVTPAARSALLLIFATAVNPINVVLLFRLWLGDLDGFVRLIAGIVMVLSLRLFAGLLFVRISVVGHEMLSTI